MRKKLYGNKNMLLVAIIGLLAILIVLIVKNKTDLKKYSEKGNEYFYSSNFEESIKVYESINKTDKRSAIWPAKISELYLLQDDNENAEKYMKVAMEKEDKSGDAHSILLNNEFLNLKEKFVENRISEEDYTEIFKHAKEDLDMYPENNDIKRVAFAIYLFHGDSINAKKIIDSYATKSFTASELCDKAMMYFQLNDSKSAFSTLIEAYELDKNEMKIYDVVYEAYMSNGNLLNELINLANENNSELFYKLALIKIYVSNIDLNKGEDLLNEIGGMKIENNFIIPQLLMVELLNNKCEFDKEEKIIYDLLNNHSDNYKVNYLTACYWLNKNDIEKAIKYFKIAIKQNEKYLPLYTKLAPDILEMKGEPNKAIPYLHYAIYYEPYNPLTYVNSGYYNLYSMNNSVNALEHFKIAQVFNEDDLELKYQTALVYLSNHNYNEAIEMLNICIEKDSKNIKYHRTLGTTYVISKRQDEAIKEINEAYELDKSNILTLNNLGCYYITVEGDIEKSFKNIELAFKSLKEEHDEYTVKTITENYNKIIDLKKKYEKGKENEVIEIPDFVMFY
ncbi:hypothetical protein UT300019_16960 [Clostridium sp. CTA-19]